MAVNLETLGGGPEVPARPIVVSPGRTLRRIGVDRWASRLVVIGGLIVIASILGILVVILAETWPLFRAPTARLLDTTAIGLDATASIKPGSEAFDVDEYREIAFALDGEGSLRFHSLKGNRPIPAVPIPGLAGARVTATAAAGKGRYVVGTSDGRALPVGVTFEGTPAAGFRTAPPQVTFGDAVAIDPDR